MFYFLDTYSGSGAADDPWRPSLTGVAADVQSIDLRPDPRVAGRCLVATSSCPSETGAVLLTDNLDSNVTAQGVQLAASWGVTFTTDMTWRQAIAILLDGQSLVVNGKPLPGLIGDTVALGGEQHL